MAQKPNLAHKITICMEKDVAASKFTFQMCGLVNGCAKIYKIYFKTIIFC